MACRPDSQSKFVSLQLASYNVIQVTFPVVVKGDKECCERSRQLGGKEHFYRQNENIALMLLQSPSVLASQASLLSVDSSANNTDPGGRVPGFESWLCHFLVLKFS